MNTKDSTRSYAYHFAKINDKANKSLSFSQDTTDFSSNFNKISFRYLAQCQQNEKRLNSPQTDLTKFSAIPGKTTQPMKKYTFSLVAKQQKQFRKSENVDYTRSSALTNKFPLHVNKTLRNTDLKGDAVQNGEQVRFEKNIKQEHSKQNPSQFELMILRLEKGKLQAEIQQLKEQNILFKVRFEESSKVRGQQEELIKRLKSQIEVASFKIKNLTNSLSQVQDRVQILQKQYQEVKKTIEVQNLSKNNLRFDSLVFKQTFLFTSIKKQTSKDQNMPRNLQKNQQQYKELLKLAGLNAEIQDYHKMMIRQVKKISILSEQNSSLKVVLSEVQRQKSKMWHHLKKTQTELLRQCNLNAFLTSELAKATVLISNCNQEINILNMRDLQRKMMGKYTFK